MKKMLLLSTLGVLAFVATTQVEARRHSEVVVETTGDVFVEEGTSTETDLIGHSGRPCRYTEGPTYKCPDCPVCPKVHCKAILESDCPGCVTGHKACATGRCHKN